MLSVVFLFALFAQTLAAPTNITLNRRLTTINNGNAFVQGTIGSMTWQASGVLEQGCTLSTISSCYHMYLTSDPTSELDTNHLHSPRQRDEFHFPQTSAGQSFSYTWKQYFYSSTGTGSTWFHLMQAFGISENAPLDYVRGTGGSSCGSATCPATSLDNYHGLTTTHKISGQFGPTGSLNYKITNSDGDTILGYSVSGNMGAGGGYIKFGLYRLTWDGMTTANAVVGDWSTS
ncbi:DOMON domain-containing protein [Mycena indigotica]|uniref:DOMON domain-containing protein n=1 Tax=Mycena indigotica TaxID=2126181 RepID=A0A8H6VXL0_9AGAR|nr:DOMON domain-containing protein [Mycena indigotica]KAF7291879.1 DOMON domain-containing protein [Mycena indigotica]